MPVSRGLISVVGACIAAAALMLAPAVAQASPSASVTRLGPVPGAQQLQLVLPLKADEAGLERLATAVNTPGSPQYGQFEPMAVLARRFGASAATRSRVIDYLRRAGRPGQDRRHRPVRRRHHECGDGPAPVRHLAGPVSLGA